MGLHRTRQRKREGRGQREDCKVNGVQGQTGWVVGHPHTIGCMVSLFINSELCLWLIQKPTVPVET